MKKPRNISLIIIVVLTLLVIGTYIFYDAVYYSAKQNYASYLMVHQEIEASEIDTIIITNTNYKVNMQKSQDNKVRIVYYQKSDNGNSYSFNKNTFDLNIAERAESINSLLFGNSQSIDTIDIYIPDGCNCNVKVNSVDGSLSASGVSLKSLTFNNSYGDLTINDSSIGSVNAQINISKLSIVNSEISNYQLSIVSGSINISLPNSLLQYNSNVVTSYGNLLINDQKVIVVDEEGNESISKAFNQESETKNKIVIDSTRCSISINSVEPVIEEQETINE